MELLIAKLINSLDLDIIGIVILAIIILYYLLKNLGCKIDANAAASKTAHANLSASVEELKKTTNQQGEDIAYIKGRLNGKSESE